MGTSVLSYSGVDIDPVTGADQALKALSNSEDPIENGDLQGGSSSSLTPQVADMAPIYSSTDSEKFLAPTYTSSIDSTPEAPVLAYSSSPALSNFENGHNTADTIPIYSSDPTDAADVGVPSYTATKPSNAGAQKEAQFFTSVPEDSHSKDPVGQSDPKHTDALFYNDDVADVKAYFLARGPSGVCYSVSARGLQIVYGDDDRYWKWSARPGARWPEVACLREVCWFHASGEIIYKLPVGVYTLSWRLQYAGANVRGWDQVPTEFTLATTDGSQRTVRHRYLSNWPNIAQQKELSDLTPVRMIEDNWFEFDAGEITVSDEEELTSLQFSMVETKSLLWKSEICLDGVVLRPSSITRTTGRYIGLPLRLPPLSAYSPLPTSTDEQGIVRTAEPLVYTDSIDSTPEAPVLGYSSWPASTDEQEAPTLGYSSWPASTDEQEAPMLGYSSWPASTDEQEAPMLGYSSWPASTDEQEAPMLGYSSWPASTDEQEAPMLGYSSWPASTDEQEAPMLGYSSWPASTDEQEAPMLGYSSWPASTDEQGTVRTTSSMPEAPVLAYSSWPTSTDEQQNVSTSEPLVSTRSSDSTPEAPVLAYSLSPTLSNFENDHNTIGTIPFYSSDLTTVIDSMSLVDRNAAVPSSTATDHKGLSYSLISDSSGIENEEAPLYTSGPDDFCSKGPVGQSDSRHTEAPFYTDNDADVKVPFYTTTWASDTGAQNMEHIPPTSASTTVSASNFNSESFGTSSPQASSSPTDSSISGSQVDRKLTLEYYSGKGNGGVCYSVSARGLRIVWGDDDRYWKWTTRPGARWPEVARLREVCWFHVSGEITCKLPVGVYTLSWRLQYEAGFSMRGWDQVPTVFTVATTDGSQRTVRHRYLSNWPDIAQQQRDLSDLTPLRLVQDNWFEFDAGEITVSDEEKPTSLRFSMVETEKRRWKSGIFLDGVVLRPSSITKTTGRYLSLDEISESSLLQRQLHSALYK